MYDYWDLIKKYKKLQQENKQLKEELQEANDDIIWWSNRFNAVQRDYENLQQRIDKAIEYCDRYLQLDLELFDSYELLKKVKEILGDKENENNNN